MPYLEACERAGCFVDEEKYEWTEREGQPSTVADLARAARRWRRQVCDEQRGGFPYLVVGETGLVPGVPGLIVFVTVAVFLFVLLSVWPLFDSVCTCSFFFEGGAGWWRLGTWGSQRWTP